MGVYGAASERPLGCHVQFPNAFAGLADGWRGAWAVVVTQQFVLSLQNVSNRNSVNHPQLPDSDVEPRLHQHCVTSQGVFSPSSAIPEALLCLSADQTMVSAHFMRITVSS